MQDDEDGNSIDAVGQDQTQWAGKCQHLRV